jgi:hypothetical protein
MAENLQDFTQATKKKSPYLSGSVPGVSEGMFGGDDAMRALMSMMPKLMDAQTNARMSTLPAQFVQAGPAMFERSFGPGGGFSPGTRLRSVTGGFAPGTIGETFQNMLPRILEGLLGGSGGFGGPSREDLLNPRLADIDKTFGNAEQRMLNRFASMGRSATGSVPQAQMGQMTQQRGLERQRAFGDVDTLLAQLGIQQQSAQMSRFQALMQMMAALGFGR